MVYLYFCTWRMWTYYLHVIIIELIINKIDINIVIIKMMLDFPQTKASRWLTIWIVALHGSLTKQSCTAAEEGYTMEGYIFKAYTRIWVLRSKFWTLHPCYPRSHFTSQQVSGEISYTPHLLPTPSAPKTTPWALLTLILRHSRQETLSCVW